MTAKQQTRRGGRVLTWIVIGCLAWVVAVHAENREFVNVSSILIQDYTNASPYPSTIFVGGFTAAVDRVTVTLGNLTHSEPADLDILLVGPEGQNVLLLSDAGITSTNEFPGVTNVTLTFDDFAPVQLREVGHVSSGTYRPTDYDQGDQLPPGAPPGPYGTSLSVFRESNPNGPWQLYVNDDFPGSSGSIGSWSLAISGHSQLFTNSGSIIISNTATLGKPYPSAIVVTNVSGNITKVTATLSGLAHSSASDLDVLLVGPSGDSVVLMSDAGDGVGVTNLNLSFDDAAIASLPSSSALVSGVFKPTDVSSSHFFDPPAPPGPYGTNLSVFNGQVANGTWQLFVVDDSPLADGGLITAWSLAISTEALAITREPESAAFVLGSNVTLYTSVAGIEPISYQWLLNGFKLPNATNSSLVIPAAVTTNSGAYSVLVANPYGVIKSEKATLSPVLSLTPAPDDFQDGTVLGSSGTLLATNFFATKEPGEPNHAGKPGGSSVWYSWTPNVSGIATFDTKGSTFDTMLGVYTGNTVSNLTLVGRDEDGGGFLTSRARFNATANQTYQIAVDGFAGKQGTLLLNWELEATSDLLPTLSMPVPGHTVAAGSNVTMSVSTSGPGLSYQWYFNGLALPNGASNVLSLDNVQMGNVGTYELLVNSTNGRSVKSEPILLEIGPDPNVQSRAKIEDVLFVGDAFYSLPSMVAAAYATIFVAPGASYGTHIFNTYGDAPAYEGRCSYDFTHSEEKYLGLIPVDDGEFIVRALAGSRDIMLELYYSLTNAEASGPICVGTSAPGLYTSIRFPASKGVRYIVAVAQADGSDDPQPVQISWIFGTFLSIRPLDHSLAELSWIAGSNAYDIETKASLSPANWLPPTPYPVVEFNEGTNTARVMISEPSPNKFFRLKRRSTTSESSSLLR